MPNSHKKHKSFICKHIQSTQTSPPPCSAATGLFQNGQDGTISRRPRTGRRHTGPAGMGERHRRGSLILGGGALIDEFIARWSQSGGGERANYQMFLSELCEVIGAAPRRRGAACPLAPSGLPGAGRRSGLPGVPPAPRARRAQRAERPATASLARQPAGPFRGGQTPARHGAARRGDAGRQIRETPRPDVPGPTARRVGHLEGAWATVKRILAALHGGHGPCDDIPEPIRSLASPGGRVGPLRPIRSGQLRPRQPFAQLPRG